MIDKLLASVFLVVFAADDDFARADVKPFQQRLDLFDFDDGRFKDQPVAVASDGAAAETECGGFVLPAEKNAYTPEQDGTSAPGETTAKDAASKKSTAPSTDADTSKQP